jgi:peptidoglycan/LPS O-acetylase OafA/YrhL
MALGIETVTLACELRATSNLAPMGTEVGNITQTATPASASRVRNVIVGSVVADLVAVMIYVTVGRSSHDESLAVSGLFDTAWPFLIGIVGGYIGIALTRWPALSLRGGAVITVKTLVIGLVLRYGVAKDGTEFSFVVVTVLVLSVLMLGWRLIAAAVLSGNEIRRTEEPNRA